MLLVSLIIAAGAFVAIKASGVSGFWMDVGAPMANLALSSVGVNEIRAPEAQDSGASWMLVGVFVFVFVLAGISLMVLALGGFRLLLAPGSLTFA